MAHYLLFILALILQRLVTIYNSMSVSDCALFIYNIYFILYNLTKIFNNNIYLL